MNLKDVLSQENKTCVNWLYMTCCITNVKNVLKQKEDNTRWQSESMLSNEKW